MEDNSKIEVSKEALEKIFKMANMEMPDVVSDNSIEEAMSKIKSANNYSADLSDTNMQNFEGMEDEQADESKNILVIDDIGVVTYQLKVLLENLGYNVVVARDIYNGINHFTHSRYTYVIMDLFVSTEQEGYTLLHETKKIIAQKNLNTKIIIITASSKAENKVKCLNGGADYFIKKDVGWQDILIDLIENNKQIEQPDS